MDFSYVKNFMDHLTSWRMPGNSIAVYKDNELVFKYNSGYSNVEKGIKMQGDELMHIYSCSKVMTVVAALQLYEQGKFLLTDPLGNYIPEYKKMYVRRGGEVVEAKSISLNAEGETDERLLIKIQKVKSTPGDLPRAWAKILKKPL